MMRGSGDTPSIRDVEAQNYAERLTWCQHGRVTWLPAPSLVPFSDLIETRQALHALGGAEPAP